MKKVFIATGGTGGHVLPSLAFAEELLEESSDLEVHFLGGKLARNRYFDKKYSFTDVSCGRLSKNPFRLFAECIKIIFGILQSIKEILRQKPSLVVGFGSYYSFPVLMAALFTKTPLMLHESNSLPGLVSRLLSPYARMTAIQFEETKKRLSKAELSAMPLKKSMRNNLISKAEACSYFGLDEGRFTILVFGGSQGAVALNQLFSESASKLIGKLPSFQLIHLAGTKEQSEILKKYYKDARIKAAVKSFEEEMANAWLSADLVISRSGASSIAELIHFALPGILIPYPYAADNHQEHNAKAIERIGGALVRTENELTSEILVEAILEVYRNLEIMKLNLKSHIGSRKIPRLSQLAMQLLNQRKAHADESSFYRDRGDRNERSRQNLS